MSAGNDIVPQRSSSRVGYVSKDEFMEGDSSFSSISSSTNCGPLPTIPERPDGHLSPPPKRKPTEDLDDIWFKSHLAEVIELDMLTQGCPYFREARVKQWPQTVIRDMTDYVNMGENQPEEKH